MIDDPYNHFHPKDMILRDWLALDRTVLANMRTYLAFLRTGIALIVLGMAFVKFLGHWAYQMLGIMFIIGGLILFVVGTVRYVRMHRRFKLLVAKEPDQYNPD